MSDENPFDPATVLRALAEAYENGQLEHIHIHQTLQAVDDDPGGPRARRLVTSITVTGKPDPSLYGYTVYPTVQELLDAEPSIEPAP